MSLQQVNLNHIFDELKINLISFLAHCVNDKGTLRLRETTETAVYLGKHNLNDLNEPGFEKRGVRDFFVHPDWKPLDKSYDADIAIIVMDSPVEYSDFIRPICVWEFSEHLHEVVGQQGTMAGLYFVTILTKLINK